MKECKKFYILCFSTSMYTSWDTNVKMELFFPVYHLKNITYALLCKKGGNASAWKSISSSFSFFLGFLSLL